MHRLSRLFTLALAATAASASWAQTISASQELIFGSFAAGTGGTVTLSAAGARSAGGGVVLVSSGGGAAASFSVGGSPNQTYSIALPGNGVVFLSSGGHSMAVNNFTSNPSGQILLGDSGTQALMVGATLSVGNNQPPGNYSGTYAVTVVFP